MVSALAPWTFAGEALHEAVCVPPVKRSRRLGCGRQQQHIFYGDKWPNAVTFCFFKKRFSYSRDLRYFSQWLNQE